METQSWQQFGSSAMERHERVWGGALVNGRENENVGKYRHG